MLQLSCSSGLLQGDKDKVGDHFGLLPGLKVKVAQLCIHFGDKSIVSSQRLVLPGCLPLFSVAAHCLTFYPSSSFIAFFPHCFLLPRIGIKASIGFICSSLHLWVLQSLGAVDPLLRQLHNCLLACCSPGNIRHFPSIISIGSWFMLA